MGKVAKTAAATAAMRQKKKERHSKASLPSTPSETINYYSTPASNRRSARRNPNFLDSDEFVGEDDEDDDERTEKKVKLVVRLPESHEKDLNQKQLQSRRHSRDYASGSDSDLGSEDQLVDAKKRRINAIDLGSNHADSMEEKEVSRATHSLHGSPMDSGPTTLLPDKTLLVFILDRLQKKDTYRVFSEPVDPNELPDYFEIIEQPMDFGTVRKKLDVGAYKNLEELEADVFLICSNAMQYNASDTVYYRQARSIQELAKRDFENLKHEGDDGEPQPKVVRRGRPPSKTPKKSVDTSPVARIGPDLFSGAPLTGGEDKVEVLLASGEGKVAGSNSYNLRKTPMVHRFGSTDPLMSSYRLRNGENHSEWLSNWNDFPASILRADMKYGNKQFTVDENRRDTYRQCHPLSFGNVPHVFSNAFGNVKQLVPVGLQEPLAYARSLARYAANLGPVAWIIASKKIGSVLPSGMQYGPGWVGENVVSSQLLSSFTEKQKPSDIAANVGNLGKFVTPSTSDLSSAVAHGVSEGMVEAVRKLNSLNELSVQGIASSQLTRFQTPQIPMYQSSRNGFNGMFGYGPSAVKNEKQVMPEHLAGDRSQMAETASKNELSSIHSASTNHVTPKEANWNTSPPWHNTVSGIVPVPEAEMWNSGKPSWQTLPMQQRQIHLIPPDLNARVAAGSPTSS